jgi:hypothetical protein
VRLLAVLGAAFVVACGTVANEGPRASATPHPAELVACSQSGYTGTVVGAFTLRAADLAQQEEIGKGPDGPRLLRSSFRDYAPDTPIVLCFFDGPISAPGGPPRLPPATPRPPYDRYVVTIDPLGNAKLVVAGRRDAISVTPRLP